MTRRSPPTHLSLLPPHLPTPPRGAPKFSLPCLPRSLPTITHCRHRSVSSVSSVSSMANIASLDDINPINPVPTVPRFTTLGRRVSHARSESQPQSHSQQATVTELYKPAEEGAKPPWVRSRGFDVADAELGWAKAVKAPKGVMVSDRE
ncbi:hypothetical protein IAT40_006176 [Kwoniella sp. CBS 6097]